MAPPQPQRLDPATTVSSLTFNVCRRSPELISPAKPTPRELKPLSDIDDQEFLRCQIPFIHIYRCNPSKTNVDPVRVIRQALTETLVYFYPFAGRLREWVNKKLMVDCTGEGVLFIEADADVTLDYFGDALQPPFPCFDELLFDVPGSSGILDSPLLLIQVTRLKCGGFIVAIRLNHTMSDAGGLLLFMKALSEFARGANAPSIPPVWDRHLLRARVPPQVTHAHHEYDDVPADAIAVLNNHMVQRSFFFGPTEISAVLGLIQPPDLLSHSTISEVLTAFLWRYRTIALDPNPNDKMRITFAVIVHSKLSPPLPPGYYGNTIATPTAMATAKDLIEQPLEHALKLIQKAKYSVTEEYIRSVTDLMVTRGRLCLTLAGTYMVSDTRRLRFMDVDFGWGNAIYSGLAMAGVGTFPGWSYFMSFKNKKGEDGILFPMWLPERAMERFFENLDALLHNHRNEMITKRVSNLLKSAKSSL